MVLPIVTPAPVVAFHAEAFRDLFDNQCEFVTTQVSQSLCFVKKPNRLYIRISVL